MTLLDAPAYNERRARRNQIIAITSVIVLIIAAIAAWLWFLQIPWQFWHWPSDHKINQFMSAVENGDFKKAYGMWNNDPSWQQHPQKYEPYNFNEFMKDWGPNNQDYGPIKSHQIIISHHVGNGVIVGVRINGQSKPLFLRVDDSGTIGFSPVELYSGP